jgi:hypothetical protein
MEKKKQARNMLAEIYNRFNEAKETSELKKQSGFSSNWADAAMIFFFLG